MQNPQQHKEELARVSSDLLPNIITSLALLTLFLGVVCGIAAFTKDLAWLLTVALSSVLASPFLFGFADIIRSLRVVARESLG